METQNVTLSIPKDVLRKAKILAIQRNISLSNLLTLTLEELVSQREGYDQARHRNMEILRQGFNLGTEGNIDWKREELYERKHGD